MSKGLVMEKHRKYMIVLTKDGMFQKAVPQDCAEIGEEVDFEPFTDKRRKFVLPSMGRFGIPVGLAAAVVLLLVAIPFYSQPGKELKTYAYVSIDINPSIELQVDESMRVKKLTPLNKDAKTVQGSLNNYEGEDITKVVDDIMIESEEHDLIAHGKKMLVGVSYANGDQNKKASVLDHLRNFFRTDAPDWKVASYKLPENLRKLAHEENLSANELLAKKLHNADDYASLSEKDREIIHSFYEKKNKEAEKATLKEKAKSDKAKKEKEQSVKQEQNKAEDQPEQKVVTPPTTNQTQTQTNNGQSNVSTPPTGSSGSKGNSTSGTSTGGNSKKASQQPAQYNNSNSNANHGQDNNYGEQNNNQYNHNQQYDYKNNNPYRNNDYNNQYKNRGEQYRNKYQNQDDDDDDDD